MTRPTLSISRSTGHADEGDAQSPGGYLSHAKLLGIKKGDQIVIVYRFDEEDLREVQVVRNKRKESIIVWRQLEMGTAWGEIPYNQVKKVTWIMKRTRMVR